MRVILRCYSRMHCTRRTNEKLNRSSPYNSFPWQFRRWQNGSQPVYDNKIPHVNIRASVDSNDSPLPAQNEDTDSYTPLTRSTIPLDHSHEQLEPKVPPSTAQKENAQSGEVPPPTAQKEDAQSGASPPVIPPTTPSACGTQDTRVSGVQCAPVVMQNIQPSFDVDVGNLTHNRSSISLKSDAEYQLESPGIYPTVAVETELGDLPVLREDRMTTADLKIDTPPPVSTLTVLADLPNDNMETATPLVTEVKETKHEPESRAEESATEPQSMSLRLVRRHFLSLL